MLDNTGGYFLDENCPSSFRQLVLLRLWFYTPRVYEKGNKQTKTRQNTKLLPSLFTRMAMAEDAASVLEQFVQDGKIFQRKHIIPPYSNTDNPPCAVANLPAEIAHLLEEIQAKDRIVQECRNIIATRDNSIQKFLKLNGAGQPNPKDDGYCKNVMANYDKAQVVQEEKVGLSEKAALLVSLPNLLSLFPSQASGEDS